MADSIVGINPTNVTPLMRRPVDPLVAPALSTMPVFAAPSPNMPVPITPMVSHNANLDTPVQKAQAALSGTIAHGSGIDNIGNPFLRGLARAGDITARVAGSVFAPLNVLEHELPGTSGNHQLQIQRQQAQLAQAQQNASADTQQKDMEAQADQRRSLAKQEEAKAQALLNPPVKHGSGKYLVAGDGSAAGYQDEDGTIHSLNDPNLPQSVRDVGANFAPKPTKVPLAEQPLDAAEAARLNGLWDNLAEKHHLPKSQFVPGMTRADATTLAAGLNNVVGKQQGDTRVNVTIAGQQAQAARNAPIDTSDPATAAAVAGVANGSVKLGEVFGRGATTAQKAAFVAAVKGVNPNYNSGDHDIENHIRNYMIAGKGGQTLTAFNTAQTHLDILRQASDALQNGNNTAFNGLAQQFAKVSGSPAPTDFNAVKNAVKGEVSRALTGNVTVSEQAELDKDFNNASSPRQIAGVAKKYMQLIDGKKQAMRDTYTAGQSGQVNFGNSNAEQVEEYHRVNGKLVKK